MRGGHRVSTRTRIRLLRRDTYLCVPHEPTIQYAFSSPAPLASCRVQDEMPVLMKAANMICAVLRNGERLAAAAREGGGGGGRGDRGTPGSNGAGGGDRRGGGAPYNPSGPPPSSQTQPSPAPVNYQYQQQPPPVRLKYVGFRSSCVYS